MVLRSVLVAHERRTTERVSHEDGTEDHRRVADDAERRDAVFADVAHELEVVEHGHEAHRDVGDELGATVETSPANGTPLQARPDQAQQTRVVLAQEVDEGNKPTHDLAQCRGDGASGDTPAKDADEQPIEHDVHDTGGDDDEEAVIGLARRGEKRLEGELQREKRQGEQRPPPVDDAFVKELPLCPEGRDERFDQPLSQDGENDREAYREDDEHAEVAVSALVVALTAGLGNQGAATRARHEADRREDHDDGPGEVHGRECCLADEVRDEETVHHLVERGEDHHADGRERVFQKGTHGEVPVHVLRHVLSSPV